MRCGAGPLVMDMVESAMLCTLFCKWFYVFLASYPQVAGPYKKETRHSHKMQAVPIQPKKRQAVEKRRLNHREHIREAHLLTWRTTRVAL